MTIDAETLIAYVDGELTAVDQQRVAAAVAADPALAARVDAHRKLRERLRMGLVSVTAEPLPARLSAAVEPQDNVVTFRPRRVSPWRGMGQFVAIAAALGVGILVGPDFRSPTDVTTGHDGLLARGSLAHALETQSAADGNIGGTRIALTFRTGGDWCRSFSRPDFSGIACRKEGMWQLRRTFSGNGVEGEYRQAAAGPMAEAAQAMADSRPLSSADEQALLANRWTLAQ